MENNDYLNQGLPVVDEVMLWCCLSLAQAEEWVSERMQKMQEDSKVDLSNLQTKMKLLQKHQVFEAEILAHSRIIDSVQLVWAVIKLHWGGFLVSDNYST